MVDDEGWKIVESLWFKAYAGYNFYFSNSAYEKDSVKKVREQ